VATVILGCAQRGPGSRAHTQLEALDPGSSAYALLQRMIQDDGRASATSRFIRSRRARRWA